MGSHRGLELWAVWRRVSRHRQRWQWARLGNRKWNREPAPSMPRPSMLCPILTTVVAVLLLSQSADGRTEGPGLRTQPGGGHRSL